MKVILHIGAHRCATRSLQLYLSRKSDVLSQCGVTGFGPERTRSGLLLGVGPVVLTKDPDQHVLAPMDQARARITLQMQSLKEAGTKAMVVSDADLLGQLDHCFAFNALYPSAGEQMARLDHAFNSSVTDIMLNIRSLDAFWASAMAIRLEREFRFPTAQSLAVLASAPRSWRDVICDVAKAMPNARIRVFAHESFAGRPEAQLTVATGIACPSSNTRHGLPAAQPAGQGFGRALSLPELRADLPTRFTKKLPKCGGSWMPFSEEQAGALRERYQDDLMWLADGAEGRVELVGDPSAPELYTNKAAAERRPHDDLTRGSFHDRDDGRLAGAG